MVNIPIYYTIAVQFYSRVIRVGVCALQTVQQIAFRAFKMTFVKYDRVVLIIGIFSHIF